MAEMVEVPWIDGTVREVEEGSILFVEYTNGNRLLHFAAPQGYKPAMGSCVYPWNECKVVAAYTEVNNPPIKIKVPQSIGAVVADKYNDAIYIRTKANVASTPWLDTVFGEYTSDERIAYLISQYDYKVVFEGVENND